MKRLTLLLAVTMIASLTGCASNMTSKEYSKLNSNMHVSNYDRLEVGSQIELDVVKADKKELALIDVKELKEEITSRLEDKGIKIVKGSSEKYIFSVDSFRGNGFVERQNQANQITATTGSVGVGFVGGALLKNFLGDSGVWNGKVSILDSNGKTLREVKNTHLFIGMDYEDASEKMTNYFSPMIAEEFFVLKNK